MPTGTYKRKPMSDGTKEKIRQRLMGNTNGRFRVNTAHSETTKQKMSAAKLGIKIGPQPQKYSDNPGYMAVHNWMRRHNTKTGICEACGESKLTYWSNVSGDYRRDRDDFWELCVPCHKLFDYILAIEKADPELVAKLRQRRL